MKKLLSFIIVICLLFSSVFTTVYAKKDDSVSTGYINTINENTGKLTSFKAISKNDVIYLLPEDIATIGKYECEHLSMTKETAENTINNNSLLSRLYSKLNLDKLFNNGDFEYLVFSRSDTTTDYITQIYYNNGYAQTMGKSFEIDSVNYNGNVYLNLEKMMYLMHAQWCVEGSILHYYPLDYNIFDFIGEKFNYLYENSVQHKNLLYDGEDKWGHSTRVVLSHVLNDIDMRIFIPFYGSDLIQQEWYEEAIIQLATTDDSFIDDAGSKQISKYLEDSPYHKIETGLSVSDMTLENITKLSSKISESNTNKFSKWNDFSTISTAQLQATKEKITNFGDIVSVTNILVDFNEISTRSKEWGDDFINGLDLLYTINKDTYGDYGKDILKVVGNLLDEFENPTAEAAEAAMLDSYGLILDKLLDKTVIGNIESIITLSNVIIKTNPDYAEQIENADLMNTVHASINVENVFLSEFVDSYHDYSHYLDVENGTSSLNLLELLYTVSNENPQKTVEIKAITDMRRALEMFLKTSLRNKTYVYHFNYFNNGGSYWTLTTEAKELEEDIYKTYALLSELISTRDYDALLYLDESFESIYSDDYGLMRQKLDVTILKEDSASDWVSELTQGYWENKGQSFNLYKFNENGTGKVYCVAGSGVIDTTKLDAIDPSNIDSFSWKIDGDYLYINEQYKLKFVSKSDDYNWDMGIYHQLPETEGFFYETEFVEDELGLTNAFYLAKYNSKQSSNNNLVANDNDFNELVSLLKNIDFCGYPFEYSSSSSDAYINILSELLGPYTGVPLYRHIYGKEETYVNAPDGLLAHLPESKRDPQNCFGEGYRYGKISADEIDWIIKNVFNVEPDRNKATVQGGENCSVYYFDNYYYFSCGDGGDVVVYPVITNKKVNSDNSYDIEYDLISSADNTTREGSYKVVCKLKNINNKRQWTLISIKDNNGNSSNTDASNQTSEQLRKSIVGSWGLMGDYTFDANGNCYFMGDKNNPGTYKITDDKTLIIDFPWTHNQYTWSDLSFDAFHVNHDSDEYFWYFTTDGVLRLNGSDYYRDGLIPLD